jgi:hypothetical protein
MAGGLGRLGSSVTPTIALDGAAHQFGVANRVRRGERDGFFHGIARKRLTGSCGRSKHG